MGNKQNIGLKYTIRIIPDQPSSHEPNPRQPSIIKNSAKQQELITDLSHHPSPPVRELPLLSLIEYPEPGTVLCLTFCVSWT